MLLVHFSLYRKILFWALFFRLDFAIDGLTADDLNNTKKAEVNILFFNRVPKVGSQSLMELMSRLSRLNGFYFAREKPRSVEGVLVKGKIVHNLANQISDTIRPGLYSKHVAYVNFTKYSLSRPIYINLVRDPIERIISWFYYVRAPWNLIRQQTEFPNTELPNSNWLKKDFGKCVKSGDKECMFAQDIVEDGSGDHRRQMLFFCGHNIILCMPFNSPKTLQRAKEVVESEYAVVGSWEHKNVTLKVLEHYIPLFFKGAFDVYYLGGQSMDLINRNNYKPPVSEEIKNILRKNLTREIEFYEFCRQRLYKQYYLLNLDNHKKN